MAVIVLLPTVPTPSPCIGIGTRGTGGLTPGTWSNGTSNPIGSYVGQQDSVDVTHNLTSWDVPSGVKGFISGVRLILSCHVSGNSGSVFSAGAFLGVLNVGLDNHTVTLGGVLQTEDVNITNQPFDTLLDGVLTGLEIVPGVLDIGALGQFILFEGVGGGVAFAYTITFVGLEITYEPHIRILPRVGGTLGADPVFIDGALFPLTGMHVTFGGEEATEVSVSPTGDALNCLSPPHAVGRVDVRMFDTHSFDITITNGFEYKEVVTTPVVNAGQMQVAHGPLPAKIHTSATVRRGLNNGTIGYTWTESFNPASSSITSPTSPNTDIVFDTYVPGTYQYVLVATDQLGKFHAESTLTIVVPKPRAPKLGGGSQSRGVMF